MGARQRVVTGVLSALLVLAAGTGRAIASDTEQSLLMDDNELIYASPAHVEASLQQIAGLGIDRVKVSVVWSLVAPHSSSRTKPSFDATDPNAYPVDAWKRYDLVVGLAKQLGLGVYFQLTAPAPAWATSHVPERTKLSHPWSEDPNPVEFGQFAQAVGTRYSGTFVPPPATTPDVPVLSLPLGVTNLNLGPAQTFPTRPGALPAVRWWGIWNEPNEISWLSPQTRRFGGRTVALSPLLERRLTDDGYAGLRATGHARDTILIGETASRGSVRPIEFVRDLYCVGRGFRPLRGAAATALGCPTTGSAAAFVAAHPALFRAAGYAHHPYSFDHAPDTPYRSDPSTITLANLPSFEHVLDRSIAAYGRSAQLPIYLTEWGYKTNPPNPFVHTSLAQQSLWLNQGEFMTWKDPRIVALAQFLLYDDRPRAGAIPGTLSYWSTFQSGLYYSGGNAKPSLGAFRLPIWLPSPRHGQHVTIWGELRPAARSSLQHAVIEYRPTATAAWATLGEVQTSNLEGYLVSHIAIPAAGMVRLDWLDPASGVVYYSRTVPIS